MKVYQEMPKSDCLILGVDIAKTRKHFKHPLLTTKPTTDKKKKMMWMMRKKFIKKQKINSKI